MPEKMKLGSNKPKLLAQLKKRPTISEEEVRKLLDTYEDLTTTDMRGCVNELILDAIENGPRDPKDVSTWNNIPASVTNSEVEIRNVIRLLDDYLNRFPNGYKKDEAENKKYVLQDKLVRLKEEAEKIKRAGQEEADWEELMQEKSVYGKLKSYHMKYPDSVHNDELDDLMWNSVKLAPSLPNFDRYVNDWPNGKHVEEAFVAIDTMKEWDDIKRSHNDDRKVIRVKDYMDNHPDSPFERDIKSLYAELRDELMRKMKKNPTKFDMFTVQSLIDTCIFSKYDLIDEDLMTEESWELLKTLNRDLYPNIQAFQIEDPNITAQPGCTDIYLFGTPGTGKTCLLMGLAGANGNGYSLNMKINGGPYASALQQYVNAGITTGHTYGKYVTTINGQIYEHNRKNEIVNHNINLIEMSGEEFALRIADNNEVSLANMGTGATRLLQNDNRKVFLIVVDCSGDMVEVDYIEEVKDEEGFVIEQRPRKRYVSQLDILNKFVSLFIQPENQRIMERVDAIHFIVTKADMLGDPTVRGEKARDLLLNKYIGPVEQLKAYCRQTKRINYTTSYSPKAFTFSLGKFYLGDIFRFNNNETLQIVDSIRKLTSGSKETSWWGRFKEMLS